MKARFTATVAAALAVTGLALAADLKSGPQQGQGVGAFNPLHCTGAGKGNKSCLV
jgi:hypothetical protein